MIVYWFVCPNIYLDIMYSSLLGQWGFVTRRDRESPIFFFKCRLGLPGVRKVSGVVTMKSIDMYIVHDSSLVVSFLNILAYFALKL